jgi:hypothetical protein
MTVPDVAEGFDVHDHRERLKLLHRDADSYRFEVRGALSCPACGREMDRLLVTTRREVSFDAGLAEPFCVVRAGEDQLLVATHEA